MSTRRVRAPFLRMALLALAAVNGFPLASLAQVTVEGVVVTAAGEPVNGATVTGYYLSGARQKKSTKSDAGGAFVLQLPAPPISLEATKKGFNITWIDNIDRDNDPRSFRLVLDSGGVVRVLVDGIEEGLWASTQVKAVVGNREFKAHSVKGVQVLDFNAPQASGVTAEFRIGNLPAGTVRIEVIPPVGKKPEPRMVNVVPGKHQVVRVQVEKQD